MTSNDKKLENPSLGLTPTIQIVVLAQPPAFVFWDTWFHVGVTLRSILDSPVFGVSANVTAELVQAIPGLGGDSGMIGGEYAFPNPITTVCNAQLDLDGVQPIPITIPYVDSNHSNSYTEKEHVTYIRCKVQRKQIVAVENVFSIRFSSFEPFSFPELSEAMEFQDMVKGTWILTHTRSVKMVTSCLQVVVEDWPEIWYKDEGGKDNFLSIRVRLVDHQNQPVLSRCFQLFLTLVYDNDVRSVVTRQDKLRLLGPRKIYIDPETGCCSLSFRIDDVSKNHQGLGFRIRIDAETSIEDVAPAFTPSVSVRSKRNKRHKDTVPDAPTNTAYSSSYAFSPPDTNRPTNMSTIQDALKSVTEWANVVVQNLHSLRWNVIGYAQHSDGTLDYSKPFHAMQNPNDFISKTLFMYNTEVEGELAVLQSFIESKGNQGLQRGKSPGKKIIMSGKKTMRPTSISRANKYSSPSSSHSCPLPINHDPIDLSEVILSFPHRKDDTPHSTSRNQPSWLPQQQLDSLAHTMLPTVTPMHVNETSLSREISIKHPPQFPMYFDELSEEGA